MKKIIRAYILFAVGIAITPCLVGFFPSIFPLTVGGHLYFIFMLLLPGLFASYSVILLYLLHPCLYLLLNLYVLRRVSRNMTLTPARAFLPSQIVVLILAGCSILYWFFGWHEGIYGFPDPINLIRFGILNTVVLFLLLIAPDVIVRRLASREKSFSNILILGYNFCIYVAFLLILFPWMGEAFL